MTDKLQDKNRRVHLAKVLSKQANKKGTGALQVQIQVIRKDALKLRADLAHGYELIKEWMETVISKRTLFK